MGFDPTEPRDAHGRWTDDLSTETVRATMSAASDAIANLLAKAKEAAPEVEQETNLIAQLVGGRPTAINLKGETRIREKVEKEEGGDVSKIKDAVRSTIVIDYEKLDEALRVVQNTPGLKVKLQVGDEFFGYRGIKINYRTSNGIDSEIQINSPGMLYAKEAKKDGTKFLTDQQYKDIERRTGLPPGLGHVYYEEIRSLTDKVKAGTLTPQEEEHRNGLIQKSKQDYANFYGF